MTILLTISTTTSTTAYAKIRKWGSMVTIGMTLTIHLMAVFVMTTALLMQQLVQRLTSKKARTTPWAAFLTAPSSLSQVTAHLLRLLKARTAPLVTSLMLLHAITSPRPVRNVMRRQALENLVSLTTETYPMV